MDDLELQRIKEALKKIFVKTSQIEEIFKRLDLCRESFTYENEPKCILITGDTGVGKTGLLKQYQREHPPVISKGVLQRRPVVRARIPSNRSLENVARRMLKGLEFPNFKKIRGNRDSLFDLVTEQIEVQQVEIVMLDEFQHAVERAKGRSISGTGDLFKNFAKEDEENVCVSLAVAGMEDAEKILNNRQIASLFCFREHLERFNIDSDADSKIFMSFLAEFDEQLPYCSGSGIAYQKTAEKIFNATGGNLRFMMRLIKTSVINAYMLGERTLTNKRLAETYDLFLSSHFPGMKNPFK